MSQLNLFLSKFENKGLRILLLDKNVVKNFTFLELQNMSEDG